MMFNRKIVNKSAPNRTAICETIFSAESEPQIIEKESTRKK